MKPDKNNAERGSVLMEYVILQLFVALPLLVMFFGAFYNPHSGFIGDETTASVHEQNFVGFGRDFVEYFQTLTNAISLPIP